MNTSWLCYITIFAAYHPFQHCTKLLPADGGKGRPADQPRWFNARERPIDSLASLFALLHWALDQPRVFVVRGKLVGGGFQKHIRRKIHSDPDCPATLAEVPRRWVALDVDHLEAPTGLDIFNVADCARVAIGHLPPEFARAACIAMASANHTVLPGLRLRLWYWLDRPVVRPELEQWLAAAPVDKAVFRAAEPIYTSRPLREDGRPDHIPERLVMLSGEPTVVVPRSIKALRKAKAETPLAPEALRAADDQALVRILVDPRFPNDFDRSAWVAFLHALAAALPPDIARRVALHHETRFSRREVAEGECLRVFEGLKDEQHKVGADHLIRLAERGGIDCTGYRAIARERRIAEARAEFQAQGLLPYQTKPMVPQVPFCGAPTP